MLKVLFLTLNILIVANRLTIIFVEIMTNDKLNKIIKVLIITLLAMIALIIFIKVATIVAVFIWVYTYAVNA